MSGWENCILMNRTSLWRGSMSAVLTAACLLAVSPFTGSAQEKPVKAQVEEVLKGLSRSRGLGPVAVSPDGSMLAFVHRAKDGWQVALAPFSDPAKMTRVTASKKDDEQCGEGMVAWAPDSRRLAFVGNCPGGGQDRKSVV